MTFRKPTLGADDGGRAHGVCAKGADEFANDIEKRLGRMGKPTTAAVRQLRREMSRHVRDWEGRSVIEVAERLVQRSHFLLRFIAYELILFHRSAMRGIRSRDLERLGHGIDSWQAVDTFASYLSGPAWREGQVPDTLIRRWARSPDRWRRRAALVSTVPLNNKARGSRSKQGEPQRTLDVSRLLIHDQDDMVVKALSWALRELAKRHPTSVHQFMRQYKGNLAPRVVREVGNKLVPAQ